MFGWFKKEKKHKPNNTDYTSLGYASQIHIYTDPARSDSYSGATVYTPSGGDFGGGGSSASFGDCGGGDGGGCGGGD